MNVKLRTEELRLVPPSGDEDISEQQPVSLGAIVKPDPKTVAIEILNATLQYPVGPHVRGSLKAGLFSLFGHRSEIPGPEYVNALSEFNLSIRFGERVGIIGSNGSGKSTLLRAMAGVYPVQTGEINVVGQIGTLLDISLGFEPESTGRENIYYRGMSMGVSRKDIRKAEAEIIEFAGLGSFIDLPMRTYSSGMYVRLGFAVSTQFHPDVLLIDEVFGAGDASFAEKAVRRIMRMVSAAGIVVLASHDMQLIHSVCTRVLWMKRGRIERDGPPSVVIPQFLHEMTGGAEGGE